ncbi:MAG: DNA double-strand break repair nuclease NurA [Acidilobaceae archaeon]
MPVFEELVDRMRLVRGRVEEIVARISEMRVEGLEWVPLSGGGGGDLLVVASDSSRRHKNFRGVVVYAVQGVAVVYHASRGVLWSETDADAGAIELVGRSERRLRRLVEAVLDNSAKNMEVRTVERAMRRGFKPGYALFDGSYESFVEAILVSPRQPLGESLSRGWRERLEQLGRIVESTRAVFVSKNVSKPVLVRDCGVRVKIAGEDAEVPDFLIVWRVLREESAKAPGILWPARPYVAVSESEAASSASGLPSVYTVFYALLSPWGKAYKLTVPGQITLEEAEKIAGDLAVLSVNDGYPHPLAVAHHLCSLKRGEFERLLALTAPELESGREPLDNVIA